MKIFTRAQFNVMKKLLPAAIFCIAVFSVNEAMAQQGFGTNMPDKSAAVDITSTKRGLLIPRISIPDLSQASPVTKPATSLLVYNTNGTSGQGFYYWSGTAWVPFMSGANLSTSSVSNSDGKLTVTSTTTGNNTDYNIVVNEGVIDINALNKTLNTAKITPGAKDQVLVTNDAGEVVWVDQSALLNKDTYAGEGPISVVEDKTSTNTSGGKNFKISVGAANSTTAGVVKEDADKPSVNIKDGVLSVNTSNITLAGDVTGTIDATKVVKIQGTAVSSTTPTDNQVLSFDGTEWKPTVANNLVNASNGLSKDATTGDIQLGGVLTKATSITADDTNTLAIAGLKDAGAANKIVVADNSGGVLRTVTRALSHSATSSFTVDASSISGYTDFVQEVDISATIPATGDLDVTLPTASTNNNGQIISISVANTDESPSGYLNIKVGATTLAYGAIPYQAWILKSNGSNWVVIGRN